MDPSELVRVTVVAGVSRVLSCYWEMVPASVIKALLSVLVRQLAFDCSSSSVRVAVLQVGVVRWVWSHCLWHCPGAVCGDGEQTESSCNEGFASITL